MPLGIASDALHNTIDGALVATAFMTDPSLGVFAGAAIALHELPRELGTFAICVDGGMSPRRAILVNAATGVLAGIERIDPTGASLFDVTSDGDQVAHLFAFAVPFLAFAAPAIIVRNTIRGRRIENRRFEFVFLATLVALMWSLMSGRVLTMVLHSVGL